MKLTKTMETRYIIDISEEEKYRAARLYKHNYKFCDELIKRADSMDMFNDLDNKDAFCDLIWHEDIQKFLFEIVYYPCLQDYEAQEDYDFDFQDFKFRFEDDETRLLSFYLLFEQFGIFETLKH